MQFICHMSIVDFTAPQPPMLCEFQNATYVLTLDDDNVTWSTRPKAITNTSQQVEEDIESGLDRDKYYTVTVTVTTDYGTITSSANFSKS